MKVNIAGIFGGILALISLVLPWWTMTVSTLISGSSYTMSIDLYTFQVTTLGTSMILPLEFWFGWLALVLALVGGLIGIVVGFNVNKSKLQAVGGILVLVAIIIFAIMWQLAVSTVMAEYGLPMTIGLFAFGSYAGASYAAYLSFGFWIALVAAILMLVASRKKPAVAVAVPPPPPPPSV